MPRVGLKGIKKYGELTEMKLDSGADKLADRYDKLAVMGDNAFKAKHKELDGHEANIAELEQTIAALGNGGDPLDDVKVAPAASNGTQLFVEKAAPNIAFDTLGNAYEAAATPPAKVQGDGQKVDVEPVSRKPVWGKDGNPYETEADAIKNGGGIGTRPPLVNGGTEVPANPFPRATPGFGAGT